MVRGKGIKEKKRHKRKEKMWKVQRKGKEIEKRKWKKEGRKGKREWTEEEKMRKVGGKTKIREI